MFNLPFEDGLDDLIVVVTRERKMSHHQEIEDHTSTPGIRLVTNLTLEHLRCTVVRPKSARRLSTSDYGCLGTCDLIVNDLDTFQAFITY